jgi:hypothetical protein
MLMLGLGDFWIALVFILTALSSLLCVVYGVVNWNRDGEPSKQELEEEARWEKEERDIDDKL